jgi:hypothetical protein
MRKSQEVELLVSKSWPVKREDTWQASFASSTYLNACGDKKSDFL